MTENLVLSANVSEAWASAFLRVAATAKREIVPLVVNIDTTFGACERNDIRQFLCDTHKSHGLASVETIASTIFPISLWKRQAHRDEFFQRYTRIWGKIKRTKANRNGTYFHRLISFGEKNVNQLDHVLSTWERGNHRRSALQLAVFDPAFDHTDQRQRGFPCLHQVAVVPGADGLLTLTAFYATQTMLEKAYGNYLGLIRLGEFVASEMGMKLKGVTCVSSVALLSQVGGFSRSRARFCQDLQALLSEGVR